MKNRQKQMVVLVALSAITGIAQYIIQGTMSTGHSATSLPAWFFIADHFLWGGRALVEALVIVYLFTTKPRSRGERYGLLFFEFLLIGMIVFTSGPAFRAMAAGMDIKSTLSPMMFTVWAYAMASYTAIMMAATGTAYKIQPKTVLAEKRKPKARKKTGKKPNLRAVSV